jgi:hypothetical protein
MWFAEGVFFMVSSEHGSFVSLNACFHRESRHMCGAKDSD